MQLWHFVILPVSCAVIHAFGIVFVAKKVKPFYITTIAF